MLFLYLTSVSASQSPLGWHPDSFLQHTISFITRPLPTPPGPIHSTAGLLPIFTHLCVFTHHCPSACNWLSLPLYPVHCQEDVPPHLSSPGTVSFPTGLGRLRVPFPTLSSHMFLLVCGSLPSPVWDTCVGRTLPFHFWSIAILNPVSFLGCGSFQG